MIALWLQMDLGLKTSGFVQSFAGKPKNDIGTSANPPYHLILLLSNLKSISWFSGHGAIIQIVRTEVRTPVSNISENHYNFVQGI